MFIALRWHYGRHLGHNATKKWPILRSLRWVQGRYEVDGDTIISFNHRDHFWLTLLSWPGCFKFIQIVIMELQFWLSILTFLIINPSYAMSITNHINYFGHKETTNLFFTKHHFKAPNTFSDQIDTINRIFHVLRLFINRNTRETSINLVITNSYHII